MRLFCRKSTALLQALVVFATWLTCASFTQQHHQIRRFPPLVVRSHEAVKALPSRASRNSLIRVEALGAPDDLALANAIYGFLFVGFAGLAGALVFSTYTGDQGLEAFLTKEKKDNPFYNKNKKAQIFKPSPPKIMDMVKLPKLDFVEVYESEPDAPETEGSQVEEAAAFPSADVEMASRLRTKLLAAVDAGELEQAAALEKELMEFMRKKGIKFD
ncbi:unnamed protein product [Chrysoparadoxa australica]